MFTKRLGIDNKYIPTVIMALDDKHFTGKKTEFSLYRQTESALNAGGLNNYFRLGDVVVIKLCTIDEEHFQFWNSLQDEIMNTHNPFAASLTEINSNVEGDGLGVWGGYGASFDTIYTAGK